MTTCDECFKSAGNPKTCIGDSNTLRVLCFNCARPLNRPPAHQFQKWVRTGDRMALWEFRQRVNRRQV